MMTLITDASFGGPGCAGWAGWYKADGGQSEFTSGPLLSVQVANSAEAELAACVFGYQWAVLSCPGHAVLLQNDCDRALRMLRWRYGFRESRHHEGGWVGNGPLSPTAVEMEILKMFDRLPGPPVPVTVRHVKGHTHSSRTGRYWVNRKCDEMARAAMHKIRQKELANGQA